KDYWIMHSLYGLQKLGLIFELKGGTSLSKGFKIIDRFSEDIDSGRVSEVRQQFRVAGVFVPNFDSSYNVGPNAAHDMDLHPIVLLANRPVLMIKPAMETGGGEAGRVRRKINLNSLKR
ncbi:MAG: hypothetical protein QOH32_1670, partial [Bradyrhizobium sp.]|nr:hypothetical protein [Bradyrhizobium sp.]